MSRLTFVKENVGMYEPDIRGRCSCGREHVPMQFNDPFSWPCNACDELVCDFCYADHTGAHQ